MRLIQAIQGELEDVLSKENSATRRMTDVDSVVESLRKRIIELQGKLEAEMATAAQLPDALDQVL
jgi:polyhydroxyalkanoate synthesis regulator phasin